MRLLRLLREGSKLLKYCESIIKFSQGFDRFCVTIGGFFIFCHIGSCIWFLQASLNDADHTTWVNRDEHLAGAGPVQVIIFYYV